MLRYFVKSLTRIAAIGRRITPGALYQQHQQAIWRAKAEELFCEVSKSSENQFEGDVLVDAMWDNPNYWIRYSLFRSALGLNTAREIGLLGPYRAKECRGSLKRFGIHEIVRIGDYYGDMRKHRHQAERLLAQTRTPDDILQWQLPEDIPPDIIYDGILKRQRMASVNLKDPHLIEYLTEALTCIATSQRLLESYNFQLIAASHVINFQHGSLGWLALRRGMPVVLLFGLYGVLRFAKLSEPNHIHEFWNRPTTDDLLALRPGQAESLRRIGRRYLEKRVGGQTNDPGAQYAFQMRQGIIDRVSLAKEFGWDPKKPIIAVYTSSWYDMPHGYGMSHFRDFQDWILATFEAAAKNQRVNWLLKPHPFDDWYGGITLQDLIPQQSYPHIRLTDKTWSGSALVDIIDGLVTYHGTAGIEFAAIGKPVLIADVGPYHDFGFAKWPHSRQEYIDALASDWWEEIDLQEAARRAQIFAGWYFCRPAWQGDFLLDDDSTQWAIYRKIPNLLAENEEAIFKEINMIRDWFYSGHPHYHTYKMGRSDEFIS
jgi:hypothetical protein